MSKCFLVETLPPSLRFKARAFVVRAGLCSVCLIISPGDVSLNPGIHPSDDWSSEGCGFDPCLGLRNHFLSIKLEDCSSTLTYPSSHISQTSN